MKALINKIETAFITISCFDDYEDILFALKNKYNQIKNKNLKDTEVLLDCFYKDLVEPIVKIVTSDKKEGNIQEIDDLLNKIKSVLDVVKQNFDGIEELAEKELNAICEYYDNLINDVINNEKENLIININNFGNSYNEPLKLTLGTKDLITTLYMSRLKVYLEYDLEKISVIAKTILNIQNLVKKIDITAKTLDKEKIKDKFNLALEYYQTIVENRIKGLGTQIYMNVWDINYDKIVKELEDYYQKLSLINDDLNKELVNNEIIKYVKDKYDFLTNLTFNQVYDNYHILIEIGEFINTIANKGIVIEEFNDLYYKTLYNIIKVESVLKSRITYDHLSDDAKSEINKLILKDISLKDDKELLMKKYHQEGFSIDLISLFANKVNIESAISNRKYIPKYDSGEMQQISDYLFTYNFGYRYLLNHLMQRINDIPFLKIDPLSNDLGRFVDDSSKKEGFYDKNGRVVIEPKFIQVWPFGNNDYTFVLDCDYLIKIIDKKGNIIMTLVDIKPNDINHGIFLEKNILYGSYLNKTISLKTGREINKSKTPFFKSIKSITDVGEGLISIKCFDSVLQYICDENLNVKYILFSFDQIIHKYQNGEAIMVAHYKDVYKINTKGKKRRIKNYGNFYQKIQLDKPQNLYSSSEGFRNVSYDLIITNDELRNKYIRWDEKYSNGLLIVEKDEGFGYIDVTGKEIIPCIYDGACPFEFNTTLVKKDNIRMLIDKTGKLISVLTSVIVDEDFKISDIDILNMENNNKLYTKQKNY